MHRTTSERLKRIQHYLGVEPDGVLGGQTLTALEKRLLPIDIRLAPTKDKTAHGDPAITPSPLACLTLSKEGIDLIIQHEISSEAYYQSRLIHPTWPGGDSGITIGIGYDLGFVNNAQFNKDWQAHLGKSALLTLARVCGIKGVRARHLVSTLSRVSVPLAAAKQVFLFSSLPAYTRKTRSTFPGIEHLHADAQAALVSLVYNRGSSITGESRREMAAIQPLVLRKAYPEIAQQIISMKRLWQGRGLDGLLRRRDDEAQLVAQSGRIYHPNDVVLIS